MTKRYQLDQKDGRLIVTVTAPEGVSQMSIEVDFYAGRVIAIKGTPMIPKPHGYFDFVGLPVTTLIVLPNPRSGSYDEWHAVREKAFCLYWDSSELGRRIWGMVKKWRDHRRCKTWEEVLPPEIVEWANQSIRRELTKDGHDTYSCVDAIRVARIDSPSQKRRYQRTVSCCGRHDFKEVGPDGKEYLLGFNHGH